MKKFRILTLLALVWGVSFSCQTYSDEDLSNFDKEIKTYVQKQPEKFEKTESGLYLHIENEGEGEEFIKFTDKVTFCYSGKLLNGQVFDQCSKENPVTFETRVLIDGWKEAFSSLKKGGKAKLVVPPQLGYADSKLDKVPANSVLIFDVEILDVE